MTRSLALYVVIWFIRMQDRPPQSVSCLYVYVCVYNPTPQSLLHHSRFLPPLFGRDYSIVHSSLNFLHSLSPSMEPFLARPVPLLICVSYLHHRTRTGLRVAPPGLVTYFTHVSHTYTHTSINPLLPSVSVSRRSLHS